MSSVADSARCETGIEIIEADFFADENLLPYHNETLFCPSNSKNRTLDRQKNVFDCDSRRLQNKKWPESLPAIPQFMLCRSRAPARAAARVALQAGAVAH